MAYSNSVRPKRTSILAKQGFSNLKRRSTRLNKEVETEIIGSSDEER
jgi:hypothetical protein